MKKKTWIIIACVLACPFVLVGGILGLGTLWEASAEDIGATEADREIVVNAEHFAEYYEGFVPDSKYETYTKLRYMDGSVELSYEYDSPLDDEPYIGSSIYWERKRSDALASYAVEWGAIRLGLNLADSEIGVEEDNDFYSAGDRSRFGFITYEGERVGVLFVALKGKSIFSYTLSGVTIDDPEICQELFEPALEALSK